MDTSQDLEAIERTFGYITHVLQTKTEIDGGIAQGTLYALVHENHGCGFKEFKRILMCFKRTGLVKINEEKFIEWNG